MTSHRTPKPPTATVGKALPPACVQGLGIYPPIGHHNYLVFAQIQHPLQAGPIDTIAYDRAKPAEAQYRYTF